MKDTPATRRLAIVLWKGVVGGAEVHGIELANQLRTMGVEATIVFIENPQSLSVRLSDRQVSYRSIGLRRGSDVLWHPRRYASEVRKAGPDGALLMSCGYMGAALRAGGYRGVIIAVEHGDLFKSQRLSRRRRWLWWLARTAGARAADAEVAVSDFTLEHMRECPHSQCQRRIYNGINPSHYPPKAERASDVTRTIALAFAGRLIAGKGADYLIKAVALMQSSHPVKLRIAGDGPERPRLEALAISHKLASAVEFVGWKHDMATLWQTCDIAVIPSAQFIECCPMTVLEAMACGKPVVASRNGGLPELVMDGKTGTLVPPGDIEALAEALLRYASSDALRASHGMAGQARIALSFQLSDCAQAYLDLFDAFHGST